MKFVLLSCKHHWRDLPCIKNLRFNHYHTICNGRSNYFFISQLQSQSLWGRHPIFIAEWQRGYSVLQEATLGVHHPILFGVWYSCNSGRSLMAYKFPRVCNMNNFGTLPKHHVFYALQVNDAGICRIECDPFHTGLGFPERGGESIVFRTPDTNSVMYSSCLTSSSSPKSPRRVPVFTGSFARFLGPTNIIESVSV